VEHERISNEELLELDVDLLVPAALGGVIGPGNVDRVRAPVIVEVANGPIASEVDERLREREVLVLPDVLVNAGGVTVSHVEWVQNRQGTTWSLEEVRAHLEKRLTAAFSEVWEGAREGQTSLRTAAYGIALRRIAEAVEAGGTRDYFRSA
jgi:glutamate dehydrogenase (NADP+)